MLRAVSMNAKADPFSISEGIGLKIRKVWICRFITTSGLFMGYSSYKPINQPSVGFGLAWG